MRRATSSGVGTDRGNQTMTASGNRSPVPWERPLIRTLVLVSTVMLSWATLTVGAASGEVELAEGDLATRPYVAQRNSEVVDQEATRSLREAAAERIDGVTSRNERIEQQVSDDLSDLFAAVRRGVVGPQPEWVETLSLPPTSTTTTTVPPPSTTTTTTTTTIPSTAATVAPAATTDPASQAEPGEDSSPGEDAGGPAVGAEDPTGETTSTTLATTTTTSAVTTTTTTLPPPATVTLVGRIFLDFNADSFITEFGDYPEVGVDLVTVRALAPSGEGRDTQTQANGDFRLEVTEGVWDVIVDSSDPDLPSDFTVFLPRRIQQVVCLGTGAECAVSPIPFTPLTRPATLQVPELLRSYPQLDESSVATLVKVATEDVIRQALGEPPGLVEIEQAALTLTAESFAEEIKSEELLSAQSRILSDPPVVFIGDVRDPAAGEAASDVAASFLRPNSLLDSAATEQLRQGARDAQGEVTVSYRSGQPIISEGEPLTRLIIDAIDQTGAATGRPVREAGVLVVLGAVMAVLALYISRYRADLWDRVHLLSLLGLLTVLAAGAVRFVTFVGDVFGYEVGVYVMPAVAFGYFTAVLLDSRAGILMSVILVVVTAVGTRDPGATIYALLATLAPVGFVSAASSRRAFRNSVAVSAAALAVIAAATAWIFHTSLTQSPTGTMLQAAVLAFASSLLAALVALAAMSFFESIFDVTTTLRLLDLTDRNHAALQLLQEKAFGTFNHSLMVGTLAGAAATAIGANNLLARAAAYYHDLGKTENPSFFIENQFGMVNPHDRMSPEESAEMIRSHVTDGMNLAARHRIPSSVAAGIITHHGTGVMRYFYDKAIGLYGEENVDVDDYRHVGQKPRSKEMAILMLADAVEGACRAAFQATPGQGAPSEPTQQAIAAVTDGIIREKMSDLQLNEASVTFADIQAIRNAFIEAMAGHYHQRIQYPNFP
ncbi:MAG: HDIG domain-containing protein [Acidimicrobiia bacterium]|nr:HDIG domain-containing protein [Acidimicrobiia bacterium]MYB78862.1 HDIG domain-containing protein [Acidimicrobiia bacterium]MYD40860.1 HDIG domain-containing protein [Acidimicrobiia bacterium]